MSLGAAAPALAAGGCFQTSNPFRDMICKAVAAGVTVVVAAGNEQSDLSFTVPSQFPEVMAVTALVDSDGRPGGAAGWQQQPDVRAWPERCLPAVWLCTTCTHAQQAAARKAYLQVLLSCA